MLDAFRTWVAPDTVLVSYNGKCYDAPLLARAIAWRANAIRSPGWRTSTCCIPRAGAGAACTRTAGWRRSSGRCCASCARTTCPGAQAPAAWLSYLRGGSAHKLRRVLAHNHQDVVSLSRLLRRMSGDGHSGEGRIGTMHERSPTSS